MNKPSSLVACIGDILCRRVVQTSESVFMNYAGNQGLIRHALFHHSSLNCRQISAGNSDVDPFVFFERLCCRCPDHFFVRRRQSGLKFIRFESFKQRFFFPSSFVFFIICHQGIVLSAFGWV